MKNYSLVTLRVRLVMIWWVWNFGQRKAIYTNFSNQFSQLTQFDSRKHFLLPASIKRTMCKMQWMPSMQGGTLALRAVSGFMHDATCGHLQEKFMLHANFADMAKKEKKKKKSLLVMIRLSCTFIYFYAVFVPTALPKLSLDFLSETLWTLSQQVSVEN